MLPQGLWIAVHVEAFDVSCHVLHDAALRQIQVTACAVRAIDGSLNSLHWQNCRALPGS
jgi:hypothetical protein